MFKKSILAAAVLAAAVSVQAAAPDYSNGGSFAESTVIETGRIDGGSFVREKDGLEGISVEIVGEKGLTITGGSFSTAQTSNIIRDNNLEIKRGYNIGLVKKKLADGSDAPILGYDDEGKALYGYYTKDDIEAIFKTGDEKLIKEAFWSSDSDKLTEAEQAAIPVPTLEEVLAALNAKDSLTTIASKTAWKIHAKQGDLVVKGGQFTFNTPNATTISADAGTLVWDGGVLEKTQGAGNLTLKAQDGIEIKSGTIHVYGSDEEGPFAKTYDDRQRQDRDRWTFGQYLMLYSGTNGLTIGETGTAGPDIYFSEGMIMAMSPAGITMNSGRFVVEGEYRSTLLTGAGSLTMNGGEFVVSTSDTLNRNGIDSSSMNTLALQMNGGTATYYNAQQFTGASVKGGTINLLGTSAFTGGVQGDPETAGAISISGGTVNVSTGSFIGAIKGDSKEYSPYVTNQGDITITGGTLNFDVSAPAEGNKLVVGYNGKDMSVLPNIGGIYSTTSTGTISITGGEFNFNTGALAAGEYTAEGFIEAVSGNLSIADSVASIDNVFYSAKIADNGDLTLTVNDASEAVSTITGNAYLARNASAFGAIAASGSGLAAARIAEIWQMTDAEDADVNAAAASDLRDVTNPGSAAPMFGMKNASDLIGAEVFNQASLATGVYDNTTGKRIWGTAVGDWGRVNGNSDFDVDTAGVVFGADHTFDQTVRAGFAFGALHTSSDGEGAKYTGDSYWIGMYGSWKLPMNFPLVLDADALYGWTDGDIDTSLLGRSGSADVDGDVIRVSAHASMPFELSVASVVPYIGLEWTRVSQDGYTDGKLGRSVDSLDEDALAMPIGVKFVKTIENGSALFKGTMDVAYARDLTDFDPRVTTSYNGIGLDAESADIGKDAFRFGLGVDCHLSDAWTIGAKYKLEVRDNYTDNQLKATVSYEW